MNKKQALDLAFSMVIPEFLMADGQEAVNTERLKTEEAIHVLTETFFAEDDPDFSFDSVLTLADRNRALCDVLESHYIGRGNSSNIKRALSLEDTISSIAALQAIDQKNVAKEVAGNKDNLGAAYHAHPVTGTVVGIDIETTGISPDRAYLINVGWELIDLKPGAEPYDEHSYFCGLPDIYESRGVPLENIHHINWNTIKNDLPIRENDELQAEILATLESHPYFAHNAAFEDSWLLLNIAGYAEARKEGRIIPIDTREICRKIDPDVLHLPRESAPASLENWARRRKTLAAGEVEYHQGLEDVDLMLKTCIAEFSERNMF